MSELGEMSIGTVKRIEMQRERERTEYRSPGPECRALL